MTTTPRRSPSADVTRSAWPVWLCWAAVAVDGFDLVVLGAVIPVISGSGDLGFTSASLTTAATLGLVGVGIGAIGIGPISDRHGRRMPLMACVALFSVLTLLIPLAGSTVTFTALRFAAGIGLGACLPTALAYMSEHARQGRASSAMTRMMTGYHVGAVMTAVLALWLIDAVGWRSMFVVGGLAGLALLPVMWWKLPESAAYLDRGPRRDDPVRSRDVVRGAYLRVSIGLWVASFMGLLLVYGLNTWLPTIMGQAGYSINQGTGLLLVLNVGAVLGLLLAGQISDRRGHKPTVLVWFGLAAVFLAGLSVRLDATVAVYGAVLAAGMFVFSAQALVYAFVGHLYPPSLRGTALGLAAGVGRAGAIVGPSLGGGAGHLRPRLSVGLLRLLGGRGAGACALATVPAHVEHGG